MARKTERYKIDVIVDTKKGTVNVHQLRNQLKKLGVATDHLNTKFRSNAIGMGRSFKLISAGFAVLAASRAISAIASVGRSSLQMAADVEESENLFSVSMGDMEASARSWSESLGRSLRLNRFELRKNIGVMFNMVTSMGLAREEAYEMSKGVVELANDMASFFNLPIEEAFTKIRSGLVGQIRPLRDIGVNIDDATIKTVAYAEGIGKQGEQLTQIQKLQARYLAITQQTTNAQGDLGRTLESTTNRVRSISTRWKEQSVIIGNLLVPVYRELLDVMDVFLGDGSNMEATVRGISEAFWDFGTVLTKIKLALSEFFLEIAYPALQFKDLLKAIPSVWNLISEERLEAVVTGLEAAVERYKKRIAKAFEPYAPAVQDGGVPARLGTRPSMVPARKFAARGFDRPYRPTLMGKGEIPPQEREVYRRMFGERMNREAQERLEAVSPSDDPMASLGMGLFKDLMSEEHLLSFKATMTEVKEAIKAEYEDLASTIGGLAGLFSGMFQEIAAGVRAGGLQAVRAYVKVSGLMLTKIGAHLVAQGAAEMALGSAPPPFGPNPLLLSHGAMLKAVGTAMGIAGTIAGHVGSALGAFGGGKGPSGRPLDPISVQGSINPASVNLSDVQLQTLSQESGGLGAAISGLNAKLDSMSPGDVLIRGNQQLPGAIGQLAFSHNFL